MAAPMACISGQEIYRQCDAGRIDADNLGPRQTPFGPSGEIFSLPSEGEPIYLLPRYGVGMRKPTPRKVNSRANLYALKDLGVERVLAWGPGGAITHTLAVGDLVLLTDLIDRTYLRSKTFFENSPLGFLRQYPVFCPALHEMVHEAIERRGLSHVASGVAAVNEGPRLETPAEIRMLTTLGAEVVTHTFVPEAFLARELQLCYVGICYVVNYAEMGSRHRPFSPGRLFGGLSPQTEHEPVEHAMAAICDIARDVAKTAESTPRTCDCGRTMAHHVQEYNLPDDWHAWFDQA